MILVKKGIYNQFIDGIDFYIFGFNMNYSTLFKIACSSLDKNFSIEDPVGLLCLIYVYTFVIQSPL